MHLRNFPNFEYLAPETIKEVCSLLQEHKGKINILAGGTDLLVNMKHGTVVPQFVVGLKNLPNLDGITFSETEGLHLGTLATHEAIADSRIIKERFGSLATACSKIGTPQIRSMGTIGGNVCNASPSADALPPLIALNAAVRLVGLEGERTLPLDKFFTGPGETILLAAEILSEIIVPCPPPHTGLVYIKLPARTSVDLAAVGIAVLITVDLKSRMCNEAKIVLGAVAPTPIRAKRAEKALRGIKIEDNAIEKAARIASEEARPISDVRSSASYRAEMVKVLVKQAIDQALRQIQSV